MTQGKFIVFRWRQLRNCQTIARCLAAVLFLIGLATIGAAPATAHFDVGTKIRQFVLTEIDTSTEVYVRVPVPLVFADILNGETPDTSGFLYVARAASDGAPVTMLSLAAVAQNRAEFTRRLAQSLIWSMAGTDLPSRVRAFRVTTTQPESALDTPARARNAMATPGATQDVVTALGYIDMLISVPTPVRGRSLQVRSGLPPLDLPAGVAIDNHFADFRGDIQRSFTLPGQLERAVALPTGLAGWVLHYIYQGVVHIVEGIDHVMLVVAMALGGLGTLALLRSVTAFTLGHAITLVAGFLGYAPRGGWFIPAIEAAIAATILLAAASSLRGWRHNSAIYAAIGLLHGFGFSFVLGNVLGRDAPELVPALAAFTLGIELGQLAIVAAVILAMAGLKRLTAQGAGLARQTMLVALALAACWMMIERVPAILT